MKAYKGFTLIELLVVISIIGLLSTLVLVAINNARMKARDTVRLANMKQVRTALEMYANANGIYPDAPSGGYRIHDCSNGASGLQAILAPYMPKIPADPKEGTTGQCAWYEDRNSQRGYYVEFLPEQSSLLNQSEQCGDYASGYYCTGLNWQ
jgi:type II secretion system protein G